MEQTSGQKIIIAIDGFSSCGKSTLAKALAKKLHYRYIDSGAMYRAVTWYFMQNHIDYNNTEAVMEALPHIHINFRVNKETKQTDTFLNGDDVEHLIRGMEVSHHVSPVSAIREVRQAMVKQQQKMGSEKAVVMDGRDIGSHVFPSAELKIFMTADPQIRAQRRFQELMAKGEDVTLEEVRQNLAERDHIDSTRKESPLTQADDALVLDNSHMTRDEQLEWVYEKVVALMGATVSG